MRMQIFTLFTLISILFVSNASGQFASMQVINNSADESLDTVDIWLNDTLLEDNLPFRSATAFFDNITPTVPFDLTIQPSNSTDTVGGLHRETYNFSGGQSAVIVINGINSSSTGYNPATPLDFNIVVGAQQSSNATSDTTDILFHNGSTDASTIDIYESDSLMATVANDLGYGDYRIGGYEMFETADLTFQVRDQNNSEIYSIYSAPLATWGYQDSATVILASGFRDTASNNSGPEFGLWAALPQGGPLTELPPVSTIPTAEAQIIHNSGDTLLDTVDIWVNDSLEFDNVPFRSSTAFNTYQAGVDIDLTVAPDTSSDTTNALYRQSVNLTADDTSLLVGNGIVSGSGYSPSIPFMFHQMNGALQSGANAPFTDVNFFHGITDAPTFDILNMANWDTLADDLSYGVFSAYQQMDTADVSLQVQEMANTEVYSQFQALLKSYGLDSAAVTVLGSGFGDTTNNAGPVAGLWVTQPGGGPLLEFPQEAVTKTRVQIIHNSASEDTFDIWINDSLHTDLDDIAFREASSYLNLNPGTKDLSVLPSNSTDTIGALYRETVQITSGNTDVFVGNGMINPTGYNPATPFNFHAAGTGKTNGAVPFSGTSALFHHGSTDSPISIDIHETRETGTQISSGINYGGFDSNGYQDFSTSSFVFLVKNTATGERLGAFEAPFNLFTFRGKASVIITSGFLDPSSNQGGPEMGLWAALGNGGKLKELSPVPLPKGAVQFIHNSADQMIDTVDLWINDTLWTDDLPFRNATAFDTVHVGVPFDLTIQPKTSTDTTGALYRRSVSMKEEDTAIFVSSGIISSTGYNPAVPFSVAEFKGAKTAADISFKKEMLFFHGSTDADSLIDIFQASPTINNLANNFPHGTFTSDYWEFEKIDYRWEVRDSLNSKIKKAYEVPLDSPKFQPTSTGVVLTSGFMDPSNNSGGPSFGMYLAPQYGGELIELTEINIPESKIQFIHNSADQNLGAVDIWVNDERIADDLSFRNSSDFKTIQAGPYFDLTVTESSSTDTSTNVIYKRKNDSVVPKNNYVYVADGILSSSTGYNPAPAFDFYSYKGAHLSASNNKTRVLLHHGSTDARIFDAYRRSGGIMGNDLDYGGFGPYSILDASNDHHIDLTNLTGSPLFGSYSLPLNSWGLGDSAITVVFSGFEDNTNNNNGPEFSLWYTGSQGGPLVELANETSIEEGDTEESTFRLFPNPTSGDLNLVYNLKKADGDINLEIFDVVGNKVHDHQFNTQGTGVYRQKVDVSNLSQGMYFCKFSTKDRTFTKKIQVTE